jgi:hypothetical protein
MEQSDVGCFGELRCDVAPTIMCTRTSHELIHVLPFPPIQCQNAEIKRKPSSPFPEASRESPASADARANLH